MMLSVAMLSGLKVWPGAVFTEVKMDNTTLIAMVIGFIIVISLFKFVLKLPFYLITFAVLASLAYAAYQYFYGM